MSNGTIRSSHKYAGQRKSSCRHKVEGELHETLHWRRAEQRSRTLVLGSKTDMYHDLLPGRWRRSGDVRLAVYGAQRENLTGSVAAIDSQSAAELEAYVHIHIVGLLPVLSKFSQ